ncbi:hypothetical protein [Kitasatospora sp. GP82]|uniref:hypothetical protein n=1 Tax=Kitasatospora sp. GP82 TaxID=3035089 RepID=UPI00247412ED|nr:hypothetical protein [Kitasatospora sp. GP82]MDH6129742.1 hypothetical protein [Kitasatospora sp. GP82]
MPEPARALLPDLEQRASSAGRDGGGHDKAPARVSGLGGPLMATVTDLFAPGDTAVRPDVRAGSGPRYRSASSPTPATS